jgi:hypothetical protein
MSSGRQLRRVNLRPQKRGSDGSGRWPLSGTEAGTRPGNPTGLAPAMGVGKATRSPVEAPPMPAVGPVLRTQEAVVGATDDGPRGYVEGQDDVDDVEERASSEGEASWTGGRRWNGTGTRGHLRSSGDTTGRICRRPVPRADPRQGRDPTWSDRAPRCFVPPTLARSRVPRCREIARR